jgi:NitT/TauT family transport system ATP-binding protein
LEVRRIAANLPTAESSHGLRSKVTAAVNASQRHERDAPFAGEKPPDAPAVEIDALNHGFGADAAGAGRVLEDINLSVHRGEFVTLVGPSGCGKTTLLNLVAGFHRVQEGRVEVHGRPVNGMRPHEIVFMFARDNLLPWRRAAGNVELAMEMGGRKASREKALELLDLVGLRPYAHHYPAELSQGMRQRVALARTLAADANVWLMDEPFGALDAGTKTILQEELMRVWESRGRPTVVFVTHDLSEAIALADRVVVMSPSPGRIKSIYDVNLPRPRHVLDLHEDARFLELYQLVWGDLKHELVRQSAAFGRTPVEEVDKVAEGRTNGR